MNKTEIGTLDTLTADFLNLSHKEKTQGCDKRNKFHLNRHTYLLNSAHEHNMLIGKVVLEATELKH